MFSLFLSFIASHEYYWNSTSRTLLINSSDGTISSSMIQNQVDRRIIRHLKIFGNATIIGKNLMDRMEGLLTVELNHVSTIENYAFYQCLNLSHFRLPDSCDNIGKQAFEDCNFKKVIVPKGWKNIGKDAFHSRNVEEVIFNEPGENWIIKENSFYCPNLKRVVYCGNSSLYMRPQTYFEIFPIGSNVLVPMDYTGSNFLRNEFTKTDVTPYCNAANSEDFYDDNETIEAEIVSEKIYDEAPEASKIPMLISVSFIVALAVLSPIVYLFACFKSEYRGRPLE